MAILINGVKVAGVGVPGKTGQDGKAATIKIGTVSTGSPGTDVVITNSGTENAAVLNFTIPRGSDGTQGPQGPAGKDATINGQNILNLIEGTNVTFDQSGSNLTINAGVGSIPIVTTSGTGSAYTATVPGITELTPGTMLVIVPHANNTVNPTLNINGLGEKIIYKKAYGEVESIFTDVKANSIVSGSPVLLMLGQGSYFWQILSQPITYSDMIVVSNSNDYTDYKVRGMSFQSSTPSSIPNGCIVGVYE